METPHIQLAIARVLAPGTGTAQPRSRLGRGSAAAFWFALLVGLAGSIAHARDYYVDAERGEDSRAGLKPETAWRSLAQVNQAALVPGDRVLFRRGQTWRGQLSPRSGDASGVIYYGAFGEGAKPILLGSVAMDRAEDWEPAGDELWATAPRRFETTGIHADLPAARWSLHQEGGAVCEFASEELAGAPALRLSGQNSGTQAHQLQLLTPGFNTQAGEFYLLTFQARASRPFTPRALSIMKNAAPWTIYAETESAPPILDTNWAEYTIRFQARQTADDARLTFFLGGSLPPDTELLLKPGPLLKARGNQAIPLSVDVGNLIFDHGKATGVKKWNLASLRQDGDYFYDASAWRVVLRCPTHPAKRHASIELALRKHIVDQGGRGYVTYENLALRYGAAHGFGGGETHHITIRNCDLSYIGGGHQMTYANGEPVRFGNGIEFWSGARDCLVEDCRLWEIYDAALTNQGDGTNTQANLTYRRNTIWNCEYSFEYWNRGPASHTRDIVFEHNTCVAAGYGWGHSQRPDPNGRHLMFYDNSAATTNVIVRDNIFASATDGLLRLHGRDWTAALEMDGNCWFQPKGEALLWGAQSVGAEAIGSFLRARGFDRHSLFADPHFTNAPQHDYQLSSDSPIRALSAKGQAAGAWTE